MNRLLTSTLAALVVAGTGCSLKNAHVPQAPIPFAKADYTVLGNTNAEECGTYIFGIDFGHLFANESASMGASGGLLGILLGGGLHAEASRALYYALERIPEATHLVAPRVHTASSGLLLFGFPLFGQRCATVDARGVVIGEKPTKDQ